MPIYLSSNITTQKETQAASVGNVTLGSRMPSSADSNTQLQKYSVLSYSTYLLHKFYTAVDNLVAVHAVV
jgi:hypothetical protein